MEILVKVQIELSDATKQFVESLLGKQPTVTKAAEQPAEKKVVAQTTNPVVTKAVEAKELTLEEVRKLAAPLIENYRSEIMQKLRDFKATNISTLKPEHYEEFAGYLKTLV